MKVFIVMSSPKMRFSALSLSILWCAGDLLINFTSNTRRSSEILSSRISGGKTDATSGGMLRDIATIAHASELSYFAFSSPSVIWSVLKFSCRNFWHLFALKRALNVVFHCR